MAVPKTTETRCRDGSVQARQVIKRLHKQPHPYIFFFLPHGIDVPRILIAIHRTISSKKRCRDGVAIVSIL